MNYLAKCNYETSLKHIKKEDIKNSLHSIQIPEMQQELRQNIKQQQYLEDFFQNRHADDIKAYPSDIGTASTTISINIIINRCRTKKLI